MIDWEQRRYEVAKAMLPLITNQVTAVIAAGKREYLNIPEGCTVATHCARGAIELADALIQGLKGNDNDNVNFN